jgi:hypothetical protein
LRPEERSAARRSKLLMGESLPTAKSA